MDRRSRRYAPSSEGLEDRQMLSTAAPSTVNSTLTTSALSPYSAPPGVQVDGSAPVQVTIEAKRTHISNLPYFIGLLDKDNTVPQPTVANIQNDLYSLVASLHDANPSYVSSFNLQLREAEAYYKLRDVDAKALSRDFGAILISAGADPNVVTDLQAQMNDLAQDATSQTNSQIVATNDYATVLQLAQLSGRPLVYPDAPALLGSVHTGNDGSVPITDVAKTTLTGNYVYGTNIQIVNAKNNLVLGQGAVNSDGVYQVKFSQPLTDGLYTVRVRVEDSGYLSDPSPKFTFKVVLPKPKVVVNVTASTPPGSLNSA